MEMRALAAHSIRTQRHAASNMARSQAAARGMRQAAPGRVSVSLHSPAVLQTKLAVSSPSDVYEQEADRVADQVMRMADSPALTPCACGGGCPRCNAKAGQLGAMGIAQPAGTQQREAGPLADLSPVVARGTSGGGQAFDGDTRAFMEQRFGRDFGNVRVHADANAAASARAVDAQAYTVGKDLVFAEGRYAPATADGKRLLAHELTHTVQQRGGLRRTVQRKLEVGAGLTLNTQGFTTTRVGNVYTCPARVKNSIWNEIFTSLLFSPRVFKISGTSNVQVDANLNEHMAARLGIVDFASKKQYTFGAGSAFKMNPAYWIVDATGFKPKPGVDRDKAIQDLNVHPKEYAIACLAATLLTLEGGGKSPLTQDFGVSADDWIPGERGYITNTKFPAGGTVGLEGENIIYTGKDKFWGHFGPGIEYKTLTEWFDQVKSWHGGARTEDGRLRPTIGLT
jgi:hypothetical protein